MFNMMHSGYPGFTAFPMMQYVLPFVALDLALKGFALWKAAGRKQTVWFIALLLLNTLGILPAIYLLYYRDQK